LNIGAGRAGFSSAGSTVARIDECKDKALAAYAKMADDDSLRIMADRIQSRAVRRMGELFKQFDGRNIDGTVNVAKKEVAEVAGAPRSKKTSRQRGRRRCSTEAGGKWPRS
jgi:hypothetical protein